MAIVVHFMEQMSQKSDDESFFISVSVGKPPAPPWRSLVQARQWSRCSSCRRSPWGCLRPHWEGHLWFVITVASCGGGNFPWLRLLFRVLFSAGVGASIKAAKTKVRTIPIRLAGRPTGGHRSLAIFLVELVKSWTRVAAYGMPPSAAAGKKPLILRIMGLRQAAVHIEPPLADKDLLVEDCPVGAEEGDRIERLSVLRLH